jgi:hypothetical protein
MTACTSTSAGPAQDPVEPIKAGCPAAELVGEAVRTSVVTRENLVLSGVLTCTFGDPADDDMEVEIVVAPTSNSVWTRIDFSRLMALDLEAGVAQPLVASPGAESMQGGWYPATNYARALIESQGWAYLLLISFGSSRASVAEASEVLEQLAALVVAPRSS